MGPFLPLFQTFFEPFVGKSGKSGINMFHEKSGIICINYLIIQVAIDIWKTKMAALKYSILPLSGTSRGPGNSVQFSECPTYPKIHTSGEKI